MGTALWLVGSYNGLISLKNQTLNAFKQIDVQLKRDAMSAQFTRNPLALASALEKIEGASLPDTHIKGGAAHMCIADPLGRRIGGHEGFLADALATHPPMAKRITILKGMGYAELKREGIGPEAGENKAPGTAQ